MESDTCAKNTSCSICLDKLTNLVPNGPAITLLCNSTKQDNRHCFHKQCIKQWRETEDTQKVMEHKCPNCKSSYTISDSQLEKLYSETTEERTQRETLEAEELTQIYNIIDQLNVWYENQKKAISKYFNSQEKMIIKKFDLRAKTPQSPDSLALDQTLTAEIDEYEATIVVTPLIEHIYDHYLTRELLTLYTNHLASLESATNLSIYYTSISFAIYFTQLYPGTIVYYPKNQTIDEVIANIKQQVKTIFNIIKPISDTATNILTIIENKYKTYRSRHSAGKLTDSIDIIHNTISQIKRTTDDVNHFWGIKDGGEIVMTLL